MSEAEMDQHTIRGLREEAAQEGRAPKALVSLHPGDALSTVLQKLFQNRCSMAPVLTGPSPGVTPEVFLAQALLGQGAGYCNLCGTQLLSQETYLGILLGYHVTLMLVTHCGVVQLARIEQPRPHRQAPRHCTLPSRESTMRRPAPCCTLPPSQASLLH